VSGFSLETLASYAALGGLIIFFPIQIAALRFRRLYPDRYRESSFKLKGIAYWICPIVGIVMVLFFGLVILVELKTPLKIGCFSLFILSGVIYYQLRRIYLAKKGIDLVKTVETEEAWHV
jgi:amino acid transporter